MSDAGRKSVTDQVTEKVTPDSSKSTLDKAKETLTGTYDRAADAVQPNDSKSTSQQAADKVRGGSDDASDASKGYVQTAQETVGGLAQSVADTINGKK
ncbi:heat shock protein 9/12-domain-containing protein [Phyllosticta capitalensis]